MTARIRPILRWHGGKWVLAPWIISHFGAHRCYVEPFGGAWSVGLRKERAYAEVWNDLDAELVNLFGVLRDAQASAELHRLLALTPFARDEFFACYELAEEPIERARRLIVRSFMGHGSDGASGIYRTGFRAATKRNGTTPAHDWAGYPDALLRIIDRVKEVTIESRDAIEVMRRHDGPDTLHYVDPPYLAETRKRANRRADNGGVYRHELTNEQHAQLLADLVCLEGMVVLSGYPAPLYDQALVGWRRIEHHARADGALKRTEVIWLNPAAARACPQASLFELAA